MNNRIIESRVAGLLQIQREAKKHEEECLEQESAKIQQLRKTKINELSTKLATAKDVHTEMSAFVSQATKQLLNSKSIDSRLFLLLKLLSETEEVSRTKQALQSVTAKKKRTNTELATLKTELTKAIEEFYRQLVACRPKPYRPSSAKREEREKLESRKTELLDTHRKEKATQMEKCYDSQN